MADSVVSEVIGLEAYTKTGTFLGHIRNVIIDVEESKVESLFIEETNPLLVEDSMPVAVPYRWVQSVGDIVILKYFPKKVVMKKEEPPVEEVKKQ